MAKLNIELCPETGICSVFKEDGTKIDMMPGEVEQVRAAAGDAEKIKDILSQVDPSFSGTLESDQLDQLSDELK
jgi:hypothetical protein